MSATTAGRVPALRMQLSSDSSISTSGVASATTSGNARWVICALLFFAASVNYMDRQVIALLKPTLQAQFGWTEIGYSNIVLTFQFAYGTSLLVVGKVIDRIGTRKGFSLAVLFWSISAMAHAAAGSVFQFALARLSLGIGESGSFPASIKAVAEWFPKKERALATGLFNSGTNVGAIITPLIVPWITLRYRMADGVHLDRGLGTAFGLRRGWLYIAGRRRAHWFLRKNWRSSKVIGRRRGKQFHGEFC